MPAFTITDLIQISSNASPKESIRDVIVRHNFDGRAQKYQTHIRREIASKGFRGKKFFGYFWILNYLKIETLCGSQVLRQRNLRHS